MGDWLLQTKAEVVGKVVKINPFTVSFHFKSVKTRNVVFNWSPSPPVNVGVSQYNPDSGAFPDIFWQYALWSLPWFSCNQKQIYIFPFLKPLISLLFLGILVFIILIMTEAYSYKTLTGMTGTYLKGNQSRSKEKTSSTQHIEKIHASIYKIHLPFAFLICCKKNKFGKFWYALYLRTSRKGQERPCLCEQDSRSTTLKREGRWGEEQNYYLSNTSGLGYVVAGKMFVNPRERSSKLEKNLKLHLENIENKINTYV